MKRTGGKIRGAYDAVFYDGFTESSERSASVILNILLAKHKIESIVDIGCGVGAWLKTGQQLGAKTVRGFDGPWVNNSQLLIAENNFNRIDFENADWPDFGIADLAISLEVAEHLSPRTGRKLVGSLCACSPVVLFSAATPYQGGEGHQNEQWQSYWASIFLEHGYKPSLFIRRAIWTNEDVNFWYRQNTVLYFNPTIAPHLKEPSEHSEPMDIVHPKLFDIRVIKRARRGRVRRLVDALRMR